MLMALSKKCPEKLYARGCRRISRWLVCADEFPVVCSRVQSSCQPEAAAHVFTWKQGGLQHGSLSFAFLLCSKVKAKMLKE